MTIVSLFVILIIVGLLLGYLETSVPMDRTIKNGIHLIAIIVVLLYALRVLGVWTGVRIS